MACGEEWTTIGGVEFRQYAPEDFGGRVVYRASVPDGVNLATVVRAVRDLASRHSVAAPTRADVRNALDSEDKVRIFLT